ncbi:hypothetical protein ACHAXS_012196 [Conticribra weissflogii]
MSTTFEPTLPQYTFGDKKPAALSSPTSSTNQQMPLKKRSPRPHKSMHPHKRMHQMKSNVHKRMLYQRLRMQEHPPKNYGHINRVKFALFLKVLMKHLSLTDAKLHEKAQLVIRECILNQRSGELQDTPLMSALKGRLYGLVGSKNWEACERYLESYLEFHNIKSDL